MQKKKKLTATRVLARLRFLQYAPFIHMLVPIKIVFWEKLCYILSWKKIPLFVSLIRRLPHLMTRGSFFIVVKRRIYPDKSK